MLRYLLIILMLAAALTPASYAAAPAKRSVFKHATVDSAWQASQKSKRPMLLFVSSNNCHYCVKMLKQTYSNPQIAAALAASSESVAVKKEQNQALIKKLKVRAYPTTLVVAPNGKEIARVEGFLSPKKFAARMFRPTQTRQASHTKPTKSK